MAPKIRYMTTLTTETIEQIKQLGEFARWNDNSVIEIAVETMHARIFNGPNPIVTIEQVIEMANKTALAE